MEEGTVPEPKVLIRALRERLGLKQAELLERSDGAFTRREDLSKFENGQNQATSHAARAGLAKAFGVPLAYLAAYLDGLLELEELVRRRDEPEAKAVDTIAIPRGLLRASIERALGGRKAATPEAVEVVARAYPVEPAEGWAEVLEVAERKIQYAEAARKGRGTKWKKKNARDGAAPTTDAPPAPKRHSHPKRAANH